MTNEIKFREIENLLNEALAASLPRLKEEVVLHRNCSVANYHYKAMNLEWHHGFSMEWKAGYESACTTITVGFSELTLPNEVVKVNINSYLFTEGRDSRIEIKKSYELEIKELLYLGLYEFLKNTFSFYKVELEEHM